jgi:GTP-binding protein
MKITSAKYITSAVNKSGLILDETPEISFVGRSNVGKSSLINNLVGIKRLAKTSSTPGLTKMVNYFDINGNIRFVDLPGYGYAKVGRGQKDIWSSLMGDYLALSQSLKLVFVLVDVRHEPSELDRMMIDYLIHQGIPFAVIATKADKLSKMAINKSLQVISKSLNLRKEMIFVHSSETSQGKESILEFIENAIEK